jgi:single-stranded DNA-binding protein
MEQITIIGNIGKAEVKESNGIKQLMFSVAVDNSYKDQSGTKVERTNWYTVFSSEVKRAEWIKKGAKVFVQGRFSVSLYKANDGRQLINYTVNNPFIEIVQFAKDENDKAPATPSVELDENGLPF